MKSHGLVPSKLRLQMNFILGTLHSDDTQAITTGFDEIQDFIKEPPPPHLIQMQMLWNGGRKIFRLATMCVSATSVPSERVFSISGNIVNTISSSYEKEVLKRGTEFKTEQKW